MTLAWELEHLRNVAKMRLGDPAEQQYMLDIIDKIRERFRKIEDALR